MSDRKCSSCGIREDDSRTAGRGKCFKLTASGPLFEEHAWATPKVSSSRINPADFGFDSGTGPRRLGMPAQFVREDMPAPAKPSMFGQFQSSHFQAPSPAAPSAPTRQYVRMSHQDIIRECAPIIRQMRREPRSYVGGHPMKPADLVRVGYLVSVGTRF